MCSNTVTMEVVWGSQLGKPIIVALSMLNRFKVLLSVGKVIYAQ